MPKHRLNRVPTALRAAAVTSAAVAVIAAGQVPAEAAERDPRIDWSPIIKCESGGDPKAQNASSSASGALQFVTGTWLHYGGGEFAPTAAQATLAEQLIVAERAYAANGLRDWDASSGCWRGKVDVEGTTPLPVTTSKQKAVTPQPKHSSGQVAAQSGRARHAAPEVAADGTVSYTVRLGDTLSDIALDVFHTTDWQRVYAANGATIGDNPHLILPGQVLHPAA